MAVAATAGTAGTEGTGKFETENIDVVFVAWWELRLSCVVRTISIFRCVDIVM
jgi:hypothetical protein